MKIFANFLGGSFNLPQARIFKFDNNILVKKQLQTFLKKPKKNRSLK